MQMYPAYRLRDVLDEYAVTFFSLLDQGYKMRYRNYQMLANIAAYPMMDTAGQKKFMKHIDFATKDLGDILEPSSDAAPTPEQIKKLLQGR